MKISKANAERRIEALKNMGIDVDRAMRKADELIAERRAYEVSQAAAAMGRAGRGESKRRGDADHYRALVALRRDRQQCNRCGKMRKGVIAGLCGSCCGNPAAS